MKMSILILVTILATAIPARGQMCPIDVYISGHITDSYGFGVPGVTVSAGGSHLPSARTNSSGYYNLMVPGPWTGWVTPSKSGYTFSPSSIYHGTPCWSEDGVDFTAYNSSPPSITVTSPNGGENWQRGTSHNISWSSSGNVGSYVKIELYKGGVRNRTISSSTSNDGSYSWSIPSGQTTGSDYKVKITSTSNSSYYDYSNNNFSITEPPSITVTSPNGGESWQRGTSHNITWSSSGDVGSYVKIELYKGGVRNRTISSSTSNDGSYSWSIPSGQTTGSDYKVKITSTSNSSYYDYSNNNFSMFEVDVGLPVIYVDDDAAGANDGTSWTDAYKYLQDALADANSAEKPVEIRVAQGIYKPDEDTLHPEGTGDREATFHLINDVTLKGGYTGFSEADPNARDIELYETVISGDLNGDDLHVADPCDLWNEASRAENSYHVVTASGTDSSSLLDGFTITAGNSYGPNVFWGSGGGMWIYGANPIVMNCTFYGNSEGYAFTAGGVGGGGGISCYQGSPTVINCMFISNSAGAGGGGMFNVYSSHPRLINCAFIGNESFSGAGLRNDNDSNSILINCTFTGNSARVSGAGMENWVNSNPTLINCTFTGNYTKYGAGIYNYESSPKLTNCILWGNIARSGTGESVQIRGGTPIIDYCCIQSWSGGLGGIGNISGDPMFIDADGPDNIVGTEDDDLRLSVGSPCIDAGDNMVVPPDTADLDGDGDVSERIPFDFNGNPRFVDDLLTIDTGVPAHNHPAIVDMGAYEFAGSFDGGLLKFIGTAVKAEENYNDPTKCYRDYYVPIVIDEVLEDPNNLLVDISSVEVCYEKPLDIPTESYGKVNVYGYYWKGVGAMQYLGRVDASNDPYYIIRLGDVSGNGEITAHDAALAAQYAVGLIDLKEEQIWAADVTGNGEILEDDASLIAEYAVGLIDRFPAD